MSQDIPIFHFCATLTSAGSVQLQSVKAEAGKDELSGSCSVQEGNDSALAWNLSLGAARV